MLRLLKPISESRLAANYVAGVATNWNTLPDGLRHGVIRLSAYLYRDRDAADPGEPPTNIVALWRPWRVMRL